MVSVEKAVKVKDRYEGKLLEISRVAGVGVGGGKEDPSITVNVTQRSKEIQEKIPERLEGVKVKEVGKVVAQKEKK